MLQSMGASVRLTSITSAVFVPVTAADAVHPVSHRTSHASAGDVPGRSPRELTRKCKRILLNAPPEAGVLKPSVSKNIISESQLVCTVPTGAEGRAYGPAFA